MSHRFPTWWRALGVVLLGLATVTWPTAAQAATTSSFKVVHQDAAVTLSRLGVAQLHVTLELAAPHTDAVAQFTLYPRIVTRSEISPIVNGTGSPYVAVATTATVSLECATHRSVALVVGLYTRAPARQTGPCGLSAFRWHLPCSGARCDGGYPLSYSVTANGSTTTKWSLLAVQATRVAQRLRLDWIETFDPSTLQHSHRAIAVLDAIARSRLVPMTISADYRTLSRVTPFMKTSLGIQWDAALSKVLASPLHRAVAAPPGNIDFAGLVANGLSTQVAQQIALSNAFLHTITGHPVDAPVLLAGKPSLSSLDALAGAGVSEVVLPETALSVAPSTTLNWGAPFHVEGAGSLRVLSVDQPLSELATDESIEPGRRAAMTLATLAFLHFEAPDDPAVRSVVMVTSAAKTPVSFVTDLMGGLGHNPFVVASDLTPSFSSSLVGTNGAPTSRTLLTSAPSTWSSVNVSSLRTLIGAVTSYNEAMTSSSVSGALSAAVAQSEVVGSPGDRQGIINRALNELNAQLRQFSVNSGAITLTGPGTSLPITVLSRANYTVTVVVHLITNALSFPKGDNIITTLNSPTKALRVPTANHRGSSLTLQVVVTTPNDQVVLARSAIQVRIAGTSVVGYLLTIGSLLVLAYWWLRTYRRRSRGRHAR
jgi:hypothetical protein